MSTGQGVTPIANVSTPNKTTNGTGVTQTQSTSK